MQNALLVVAKIGILQVCILTIPYFTVKLDMIMSSYQRSNTQYNKYDYKSEENMSENHKALKTKFLILWEEKGLWSQPDFFHISFVTYDICDVDKAVTRFYSHYPPVRKFRVSSCRLVVCLKITMRGELQDGGGVRRRDQLPPHKYIRNTSTRGTAPTEHPLNAGRRPQTSQKARNSPRTWLGQKKKEITETKE